MQRLLVDTWRAHPTTIVFVTHDVDEALRLGDRVAVLGGGGLKLLAAVPQPRTERIDRTVLRTELLDALDNS